MVRGPTGELQMTMNESYEKHIRDIFEKCYVIAGVDEYKNISPPRPQIHVRWQPSPNDDLFIFPCLQYSHGSDDYNRVVSAYKEGGQQDKEKTESEYDSNRLIGSYNNIVQSLAS